MLFTWCCANESVACLCYLVLPNLMKLLCWSLPHFLLGECCSVMNIHTSSVNIEVWNLPLEVFITVCKYINNELQCHFFINILQKENMNSLFLSWIRPIWRFINNCALQLCLISNELNPVYCQSLEWRTVAFVFFLVSEKVLPIWSDYGQNSKVLKGF